MYTDSLRLKKEKEAKELQEQLAFDMKILEQLLEESRNEAMEQTQRKVISYMYKMLACYMAYCVAVYHITQHII